HSGKLWKPKSESVAVGDVEERVSPSKVEKQPTLPPSRAVRSTPTSRNSPCAAWLLPGPPVLLLSVKDHGSVIVEPFTMAKLFVVLPGMGSERWPVASSPTHV